ncbi:MAG: Long-chain-fatty-acid--CoA ligase [Ramlibacter sp.]|nr:Long-chain-fatty-acid--CoA ligase [Ramlibacter sp.]
MMATPLSLKHLLERAGQLFTGNAIVSRLPDKLVRRHGCGQFHRRARALASALQGLGCARASASPPSAGTTPRIWTATLAFPRLAASAHAEPAAVAQPNRLIAGDAQDRFVLLDDVLLSLCRLLPARTASAS